MTLGEEIVKYRALHNLSQGDFAKLAQVSTQTIYGIETGQQNPSRVTYQKCMLVINGEVKKDD